MAVRWMESFDLYNGTYNMTTRGYTGNAGGYVTGRFAGKAGRFNGNRFGFAPFAGSAVSAFSHGFAFRPVNANADFGICVYKNGGVGGNDILELRTTTSGALRAVRNGTVLGTSAGGKMTVNVWCYIEIEVVRHGSAGVFNIYCNGALILSLTAQNTGSQDIDTFYMFHNGGSNNGLDYDCDDMYVTDTSTRLGERRIVQLPPSADTAQKDWTPNSGTANFSRVNESSYDGDTSYITANTVGQNDLYDCADLSYTPVAIDAVQITTMARKDDATTRAIRANLKSGGSTANGAAQALAAGYQIATDIFETDPATSAAWTASAVNAMQVGPEVTV